MTTCEVFSCDEERSLQVVCGWDMKRLVCWNEVGKRREEILFKTYGCR